MIERTKLGTRSSIATIASLTIVVFLAANSGSMAQESMRGRAGVSEMASGASRSAPVGTHLALGDRLRITFFELIDVSVGDKRSTTRCSISISTFEHIL